MSKNKQQKGPIVKPVDEAEKIQQRIFEREVDEELRQEKLANIWKKYRMLVYTGVVAIILGTIGFEWYQAWQTKIRLAESDRYDNATVMIVQGQTNEAINALEQLAKDGQTGYRYLAQMQVAGILLKEDETEKGLSYLKSLSENTEAPQALQEAALLSYVGHQIDTGNAAQLQSILKPILSQPEDAFYGVAVELSALLYIKSNQVDQAKSLLNSALQNTSLEPQTKERLTMFRDNI